MNKTKTKMPVWRPIPGYSKYEINRDGDIRTRDRNLIPIEVTQSAELGDIVDLKSDINGIHTLTVDKIVSWTFES